LTRILAPLQRIYTRSTRRRKGTAPAQEEVVNILGSSLKEFTQIFIIVDAMDEYPEFQGEILLQHLAVMGSNVNWMIT
jgi:hypothetical protein